MKIIHIIPNLKKGGAERLVIDIVKELNSIPEIDVKLIVFRDEIEYAIEEVRAHLVIIPTEVSLSILGKNKYTNQQLIDFITSFNPDVIHSHLFEAEISPRVPFLKNCRYFSHAHWNTKELTKPSLKHFFSKQGIINFYEYRFILKLYKKCKNEFITISQHTSLFYQHNLPSLKNRVHYLQNAIQFSRFSNLIQEKRSIHGPLKIVSVGSLNVRKNQFFQIEIAKELRIRGIDFTLNIIGDGAIRAQLAELIETNSLNENVFLVGLTNHVEEYLKQSDLFIHTAKYEPFGLVIVEAMASGLPVLCYDGGGNSELISDNENGFLINELDVNAFADKILQLKENESLYSEVSQSAIDTAKNFDIAPYVEKLINLYKN